MATRIINVQLAFDAALPERVLQDIVSTLLTERGVEGTQELLENWRYTGVMSIAGDNKTNPFGEVNPDILRANADAIVIPVNLKGVPGAGLAKTAAERWPKWANVYKWACESGRLTEGRVIAHHLGDGAPILVDFPTKRHWRESSRLELIKTGLDALHNWLLRSPDVNSIALPALGCGLGGLRWSSVYPLVEAFAKTVADELYVRVDIYPPHLVLAVVPIGNDLFWAIKRTDGTISTPYATTETAIRAYHRGYLEWPDE
jgi:O-acetyl-ADP-ribose deacetylase (regulator of RNase III)